MEQKYHKGDKVRIVHIGWPMWESENGEQVIYDSKPEYIGHEGEIVGSYDDLYPNPGREQNGPIGYTIKWPEGTIGTVAWFHEYQLEPADINTPRNLQKHYSSFTESPTGKMMIEISKKIENKIMWDK